jgi:hypothetical protein
LNFGERATVDNKKEQQREWDEKPTKVGRMTAGVGTRYGAARTSSSMGGRQGGKAHNERWKKVEWADWEASGETSKDPKRKLKNQTKMQAR